MRQSHISETLYPEIAELIIGMHEAWEDMLGPTSPTGGGYAEFGGGIGYSDTLFRIALAFSQWAEDNVDFERHGEVWPYYCRDHVAPVLQAAMREMGEGADNFGAEHAKAVAERLQLPLKNQHG